MILSILKVSSAKWNKLIMLMNNLTSAILMKGKKTFDLISPKNKANKNHIKWYSFQTKEKENNRFIILFPLFKENKTRRNKILHQDDHKVERISILEELN